LAPEADLEKNNLDLMRLLFATVVVFFHLSVLPHNPAYAPLGKYLSGAYAVKSFFVISGMLVYRSYLRSQSLASYLVKRVRRIYPAYFTVVVLAAIALCPLSIFSASQYFGLGFWKYIAANLVFLHPSGTLPGVFASNNIHAVNASLWTLRVEVAFYLSVPLIAHLCRLLGARVILGTLFCLSCLWRYIFESLAAKHSSNRIYLDLQQEFPSQLIYFIAGIALLLYFDKLKTHFPAILGITFCLLLADHFFFKGIVDVLWISGIILVFGFWRYLGDFCKHGDLSYGIYIIHAPIIQTLVALGLAKQSPAIFLPITLSCILVGAFLMWHLVEKRFLASNSHYRRLPLLPS
jgi:peptidoglycan/LPS O-acetylase OafA/YrhL